MDCITGFCLDKLPRNRGSEILLEEVSTVKGASKTEKSKVRALNQCRTRGVKGGTHTFVQSRRQADQCRVMR